MVKDDRISESRSTGRMADDKGVIADAMVIFEDALKIPKPDFTQVDLERGYESSRNATKQEDQVFMSPVMHNILVHFDPTFENKKKKLMVDDEQTKGEKWINEQVTSLLMSFNGEKKDSYDESIPLRSKAHYDVDCWRNFKENMRQIQPGQLKTRMELAKMFQVKSDPEPIFRIFREDKLMRKALSILLDAYPSVVADDEFTETAAPFETKHTNVGFKWWQNDRNFVNEGSSQTYGQLCLDTAKQQNDKTILQWNVNTYFGRNQMKGRLITATSRVANLYLNRLEAREIQALKSVSYFAGYGNETELKQALTKVLMFCEKYGYRCENFDQSKYDMHINPAFLAIVGALRAAKVSGALGKRLAKLRAYMNIHSWVVNGMTNEVEEIWGRMFSGFIDTNQGDGLIEILLFLYCLMKQDLEYTRKIAMLAEICMLVMGDDALVVYDPKHFSKDKMLEDMDALGFEVHRDKGEFGVFFLQNRLFEYNNNLIMVYPWTRVLRSMLFLEKAKGLGPHGWLLSQYQQLHKLEECPEALDCVVRIIYPFDKLRLGVDLTVDQIVQAVKDEDARAQKEVKKHRFSSTYEKLFDGDPTKDSQFIKESDGTILINPTYLEKIHKAVQDSVKRIGRSNMRSAVPKLAKT